MKLRTFNCLSTLSCNVELKNECIFIIIKFLFLNLKFMFLKIVKNIYIYKIYIIINNETKLI